MDMTDELLILDDDPAMLVFLEGILSSAGYVCRTQTDPEAALSQVASRREIELVLSDVYMPGLTGLQFIDRLNELPLAWPPPPVLLLTAQPSLESAIDALRLGAQDFLLKPIRPPELIAAISRALSRARADRMVESTRSPEVKQLIRQAEELTRRLRGLAYADEPQHPGSGGAAHAAHEAARPGSAAVPEKTRKSQDPHAPVPISVLDTIDQLRHLRSRYTQHELDEVEWDLLLELLRAERLHQHLSVSALTISTTAASATTSLRRVNQLVARGYIVRLPDPSDARRDFVSLTQKSNELLADYLARANSHLHDMAG